MLEQLLLRLLVSTSDLPSLASNWTTFALALQVCHVMPCHASVRYIGMVAAGDFNYTAIAANAAVAWGVFESGRQSL